MKKKLFKSLLVLSFLLITFFSIKIESNAANFAYSDFDWNELLQQNRNYWIAVCEEEDTECVDSVLETKERFYTRLYEILDDVQKKYGYINDNYIIATVFYGLTPDSFADPDEAKEYNPFSLDDSDDSVTKNKYIGSDDGDRKGAVDYFNKEADSLKSLINNFIGYRTTCYGEANETPQTYTDNQGNTYKGCSEGFTVYDNKCVVKVATYKGTFFDSLGLSFLGSENEKKCKEEVVNKGYKTYFMETSNSKEVNIDFYWDFLENSQYFDNKKHLQSYFDVVLQHTGYDSMDEFYEAAANDEQLLENYKEDIIEARVRIINGIKSVIEMYGEDNFSKLSESLSSTSSNLYWWPIGSDTTTESNGVVMASEAPASTTITSTYGNRTNPITGAANSKHNGIDISGSLGVTNVIAAKDGVVIKSTQSEGIFCEDGGDKSCGGGFGNYVMIQHIDGNYTVYAHMAKGSITVEMGDSVKQGQVIGKVGNSGSSTGAHLHFEVRVGGYDSSATQDPLNFISVDTPRSNTGDIIIPDEYGNSGFFTYTVITKFNWVYNQKKVYDIWISTGAKTDRNIATIDGRYLIACTTTFGNIGDKIDFYLGDGTKIETIMFDAKSQSYEAWDHNPANKWGHNNGQQVLEFEITSSLNNSGDVGSWMGWTGQRVASATNLGENIIN